MKEIMHKAVTVTVGFQTVFWQYPGKEGIRRTLHFKFGINLSNFVYI